MALGDDPSDGLLLQLEVVERHLTRDDVIQENPADSGLHQAAFPFHLLQVFVFNDPVHRQAHFDRGVECDLALVICEHCLFKGYEDLPRTSQPLHHHRHIGKAQHDVQRRGDDRAPICRGENVVC